jgi:hypothetical protein
MTIYLDFDGTVVEHAYPQIDLEAALSKNELYIDDISEGTPMRPNKTLAYGIMVDWIELERLLINAKII